MASLFSGLKPGMMAYVGYNSEPEGNETVGQCIPFNPFGFAMQYDKFVWGILLNNIDGGLQALRPRRVYPGDTAIVLETIEGLAGYPQEVMMGAQTKSSARVCQTVVRRETIPHGHWHLTPPFPDPLPPPDYYTYWHIWEYAGDSTSGVFVFRFKVPCEYIEWENGRIEQIIPATTGFEKRIPYTVSVPASRGRHEGGGTGYNFPPLQCTRTTRSIKSAGRF